ncbi:MAG TPA: TRAP transporter small permease subunit [Roseiflexaceae bacterium]|nr:TRAP transporter small permease subunit [Roseiflexaceae bacterium]
MVVIVEESSIVPRSRVSVSSGTLARFALFRNRSDKSCYNARQPSPREYTIVVCVVYALKQRCLVLRVSAAPLALCERILLASLENGREQVTGRLAMRVLLRLSALIDTLIELIGRLLPWIVTVMILIGFLNVVLRYFGRFVGRTLTSNAYIEAQWYLFSVLFFLGFGYILKHNLNVRVDFLYSGWSAKRRAWVDLLGTVLFLIPFCILGIYVTINPVMFSWQFREISPDADGLPRYPIKAMIIVAFVLLLLQAISQTIKYLAILTDNVPPEQAAEVEEYRQVAVE